MAIVTPTTHPTAPSQLGSWVLLRELVGGPSQWLYMARHCSDARVALLKVLPPAASPATREQFLFEARLATANPEQLLQAYEVFECGSWLVAAMEWPQGEVLSGLPLPVDGALAATICLDLAYGLTAMHRAGVINGAVRSDAVLIGCKSEIWRPRAKLLDLGFCLAVGQVPAADIAAGFLAPECKRGAPVGAGADIYGLGALCFKLVTGRAWPLGAAASLPPHTPERLADLLRSCLAADPAHRPASMHQVADALEWIRYELKWGHSVSNPAREAAHVDADFGEHAGWFIEDTDELTDDQRVSLVGYARSWSRLRSALSIFALTLVAWTVLSAGVIAGLSSYGP